MTYDELINGLRSRGLDARLGYTRFAAFPYLVVEGKRFPAPVQSSSGEVPEEFVRWILDLTGLPAKDFGRD